MTSSSAIRRREAVSVASLDEAQLSALVHVTGSLTVRGFRPAVLSVPLLSYVGGDLTVAASPGNRRIEMPRLQSVGGRVVIEALDDLEELALPRLAKAQALVVRATRWLTSVALPALSVVEQEVLLDRNELLTHVALPKLRRAHRVHLCANGALPDDVAALLREDFERRQADIVVQANANGAADFGAVVRERLQAHSTQIDGDFERFVRVAPELIEVHEHMLADADRDGDRTAAVERLRRMYALARAQDDRREAEYQAAVYHLIDEAPPAERVEWSERLARAWRSTPLTGDAARLWEAELSALWERPPPEDVPSLLHRWRARGARTLMAPCLEASGLNGLSARVAARTPNADLARWTSETVLEMVAAGWRASDGPALDAAVVLFAELMVAERLADAARAFVRLADVVQSDAGARFFEATPLPPSTEGMSTTARAAADWLADDIVEP